MTPRVTTITSMKLELHRNGENMIQQLMGDVSFKISKTCEVNTRRNKDRGEDFDTN
jgi:hypothetical protein